MPNRERWTREPVDRWCVHIVTGTGRALLGHLYEHECPEGVTVTAQRMFAGLGVVMLSPWWSCVCVPAPLDE